MCVSNGVKNKTTLQLKGCQNPGTITNRDAPGALKMRTDRVSFVRMPCWSFERWTINRNLKRPPDIRDIAYTEATSDVSANIEEGQNTCLGESPSFSGSGVFCGQTVLVTHRRWESQAKKTMSRGGGVYYCRLLGVCFCFGFAVGKMKSELRVCLAFTKDE